MSFGEDGTVSFPYGHAQAVIIKPLRDKQNIVRIFSVKGAGSGEGYVLALQEAKRTLELLKKSSQGQHIGKYLGLCRMMNNILSGNQPSPNEFQFLTP